MFKNPTCQPAIAIVTPSIFLSSLRHPSLQICANFTQGNFFRDKISYKFLPLIVRLSEVCTHHYAFFKNLVHIYMKTSFQKHHQKTPPHCFLFGQSDNGPLQITLFSSLVVGVTTIVSVISILLTCVNSVSRSYHRVSLSSLIKLGGVPSVPSLLPTKFEPFP